MAFFRWRSRLLTRQSRHGQRLKTLPSRMTEPNLERLKEQGARPAGPPPALPSVRRLAPGTALEVERVVSACGLVGLGGIHFSVGMPLAGTRVTLRLEGELIHVVSDGVLVRSIASPLEPQQLPRLWGARAAGPPPSPATNLFGSGAGCRVTAPSQSPASVSR